ncbi:uncharacterized protein SCHCODRAFT_02733368 [Schizophyllum commune H4-8]|uniref:uncharacterized protein n=1 Tax=Schizophyllum commune (strain H4-8 / FGSC 9210) TaxID=578458 RepID=UPI00215FEBBC|nr:uncharacterized protein SCHCODRAFT_02733368 [Schizophyllum commune H4-8]KAI5892563.1 hypothetical protein SCHCODRAFT_02733368 [Schizophyllum commune H4-8]
MVMNPGQVKRELSQARAGLVTRRRIRVPSSQDRSAEGPRPGAPTREAPLPTVYGRVGLRAGLRSSAKVGELLRGHGSVRGARHCLLVTDVQRSGDKIQHDRTRSPGGQGRPRKVPTLHRRREDIARDRP